MLNTKSFLCLDFGAGSLKMAEFEPAESGVIRLKQFGIKSLGFEGSQEVARERVLNKAVQELLAERPVTSNVVNACAPGFHVFSKFVKLPPVDASKVTQIIQYEAQQNVPFPLDDVAWDYQILGTSASGELEVLLVAIKTDIVEGLFRTAEASGFRIQLVDVSPAALANAFRFNYGDLEGCSILLDIGAKTSNLLFFEKGKVYSRGINIGANSITQDFAAEGKLKFAEAEQFKIAEGFVSLGGAYEEPDNPRQAQISKIARQVMTRLHIQVNQTIQFYRGQQGGSAPQRLFLAGGASMMPYTAQFFSEKLNVAVEYFNPFRNIEIDPSVNLEELAGVAHALGEVVGLGLRNIAQCPVEMNLMPKSFLKRQELNQKKPYFIATVFTLGLGVLAFGGFYWKLAGIKQGALQILNDKTSPLQSTESRLNSEMQRLEGLKQQAQTLHGWNEERFFWTDFLVELRRVMLQTETQRKEAMGGVDNGVWVESFTSANPAISSAPAPVASDGTPTSSTPSTPPYVEGMNPQYAKILADRYGITVAGTAPSAASETPPAESSGTAASTSTQSSTNEIAVINVTCRAVNLRRKDATANDTLAYTLEQQLRASPMFDPTETKLAGPITLPEEDSPTFTFGVTVKLKTPMKLP